MLELVISAGNATRLEQLARDENVPLTLRQTVQESTQGLMTESSPAVSGDAKRVRVPRGVLTEIAQFGRSIQDSSLSLDGLLQGSHVYIAPPPKYERPKELDESLARIARMQEEREYARMSQPANPYYMNPSRTPKQSYWSSEEERAAWRSTREQISVIVNIALSIGAVATATWWAAGNASPIWVGGPD
ncbi:hypothetical protein MYAM1_001063 [Malassezia yamatoensis]|uniref:Uncharacterized protein n=1 Tax=Malassezia yamatoensis TaxID=253288 RepID=A0AAJ6CFI4_9BASI|nr:hypothetical protein MYAM1_001063 [Malassezia yamatoensis]